MQELDSEEWLPVVGLEEYYKVSSLGRVFSSISSKILDPKPNPNGYIEVKLRIKFGKGLSFKVHRLVAQAFIPNPENKPQVDHINCIKSDNSKVNLRWCTNLENQQYAALNGLKHRPIGEINPKCKLSETDVLEICRLLDLGSKQSDIAAKFNVDRVNISAINTGLAWNFLTGRKLSRTIFDKYGENNPAAKSVTNCRGEIFGTLKEASGTYNIGTRIITKSCKSDTKTAGKYLDGTPIKWYYKSDYTTEFIIMDNALDGHPGE